MALTEQQLTEIERRTKRAATEIGDVCAEGPRNRWRMSIPANPERDTDLILDAALGDSAALLTEVRRLAGQVKAADQLITEMAQMSGGPLARHYASRLRATLGLPDPNPCRCYACEQVPNE